MSHKEDLKRIKKIEFGDPVTNICAGDNNPMRHARFVELKTYRKSYFGVVHITRLARITYGKKKFAEVDIEFIYPGHLSHEEAERLYAPVWEKEFGRADLPQRKEASDE